MKTVAVFLLSLFLVGCSGSKVLVKKPAPAQFSTLAVLPIEPALGVRAERATIAKTLLVTELRNRGFLVIEDRVVAQVCTTPECPDRARLFSEAGADALVRLRFDSLSSTNLLLGKTSSVSGRLSLENRQGEIFVDVTHTARESGGAIFNTGQAFVAAQALAEGFQDSKFDSIARSFAKGIVANLPEPVADGSLLASLQPTVGAVEQVSKQNGLRQICVSGTPRSLVSVQFGIHSAYLRETNSGRYCAIYPRQGLREYSKLEFEIRSPTGAVADKSYDLQDEAHLCNLEQVISGKPAGQVAELKLSCDNPDCVATLKSCSKLTKVVYRAMKPGGAYAKVAEFSGSQWRDTVKITPGITYAVVLKSKEQLVSQPSLLTLGES